MVKLTPGISLKVAKGHLWDLNDPQIPTKCARMREAEAGQNSSITISLNTVTCGPRSTIVDLLAALHQLNSQVTKIEQSKATSDK